MIGFIYKLTCSETQKIYFGSTLDIDKRLNKGWYKCSCKDFINPMMEVVEEINIENINQLLERENHYIINFECVNHNHAIHNEKEYNKKYREKNYERIKINRKKYEAKVNNIYVNCPDCNKKLKKRSLRTHQLNHCN